MVKEGRGQFPIRKPDRPSPVANVGKIGSLMRYPDRDYANSLLHDAVKQLAPLIHEYNFKVGLVCEMFPKSENLLGLNVNKGQKIMLRLRYHHNERSFLPMSDILGTFLHELTHNVHGKHDKNFYDYLAKLEKRFDEIRYGKVRSNYWCEENRLGLGRLSSGVVDVRAKRLTAMTKNGFKTETKVLGSDSRITKPNNPREAMLGAALRRLEDSKRCHSDREQQSEVPDEKELEIVELDDDDDDAEQSSDSDVEIVEVVKAEEGDARGSDDPNQTIVIE
ncbi:hypothetical protein KGF57_002667 [Candida theae]|uniref:WLM domain-containing protein n=1 Tax=Candida theae TaxID=1198502 RepID=A0AAD5BEP4_9ASCO|nr:uncharacterized protein KGF57_002667 [Candida theae]KAI5958312.1 hypothetical protein KGF57_002667 [Candida theae]